jgi:hypothetical protein
MATQQSLAIDPVTTTNLQSLTAALVAQGVGALEVAYVFDIDVELHVSFEALAGDGARASFDADSTIGWRLAGHSHRARLTLRKALARCVRALMAIRGYAEQDGAHGHIHMAVGRSVRLDHHSGAATRH